MSGFLATGVPPVTSNTDPAAVADAIATAGNGITTAPAPVPVTVPVVSVKAPNPTFQKWAAALYPAITTLLTAIPVLLSHHNDVDLLQFGVTLIGLVGAVFASVLPSVKGWPGVLKTSTAAVGAIVGVLIPIVVQSGDLAHVSSASWFLFISGAVGVIAHEIGIQQRVDANAKTEENLLK